MWNLSKRGDKPPPWLDYANDDERKRVDTLNGRLERLYERTMETLKEKQAIMRRCIRRGRRKAGVE